MKKIIALALTLLMVLSGCNLFKKEPQKAVSEGIINFAEVTKMDSRLVLSGTVQAPAGEVPSKILFTINGTAKTDLSDAASPAIDSNFKVSVSLDEQKGSGDISFRSVGKKAFVDLTKLEIPGEVGKSLSEQMTSVLNTWWSMPVSDQSSFEKLAKDQKNLIEKFKNAQFFTNAVEEGEEAVEGVDCIRYRVDLDKEAFKKFLLDLTTVSGTKLTPEDELALGESLKDVEFSGALWIGDDDVLHRVRGTITIQPTVGGGSSFEIDYSGWNYGEDVAVSEPEGAKEFNPLMMLPLLGAISTFSQEDAAAAATTPAAGGAAEPIDQPLGAAQTPK